MNKITIMLTKENYKTLTDLADRLALSKSAALRLLISNAVKNKLKLIKVKNKKDTRFTFVSSANFKHLQQLQNKYKNFNITEILNSVIAVSAKTFKPF